MTKSDIVRKYIDDNPGQKSDRGIAARLCELYPKQFSNFDNARALVKMVTGKHKLSKQFRDPEKTKYFTKFIDENISSDLRPWDEPFIITSSIKQLTVIADLHSVNLDARCFHAFLKNNKNKEALLINGDLMDSESLSRHLKGHNMIEYDRELDMCHEILKGLKEEFTHVYFKEGNHDFWLERYLLNNAREIFRLRGIQLKELLRLGELGVHHIHNLKSWRYGDLDGVHGHEFNGFGFGKFPANGLLDRWQTYKGRYDVKVLSSHCHRHDVSMSKKSKDGKFGQAWVTPAMCRKGAQYNPYAGWDLGWTNLTINNDGQTEVKIEVFN